MNAIVGAGDPDTTRMAGQRHGKRGPEVFERCGA